MAGAEADDAAVLTEWLPEQNHDERIRDILPEKLLCLNTPQKFLLADRGLGININFIHRSNLISGQNPVIYLFYRQVELFSNFLA